MTAEAVQETKDEIADDDRVPILEHEEQPVGEGGEDEEKAVPQQDEGTSPLEIDSEEEEEELPSDTSPGTTLQEEKQKKQRPPRLSLDASQDPVTQK